MVQQQAQVALARATAPGGIRSVSEQPGTPQVVVVQPKAAAILEAEAEGLDLTAAESTSVEQ